MPLARELRRIDEFAPRQPQRHAADVAREEWNVDDGDGVERIDQARPENGDDGKRQQDVRKRHQHVDAAHHQIVGSPARIAGHEPDQRAEEGGDQARRYADGKADAKTP
jgi:hypothetical protein